VLLSSHDMAEVEEICNDVTIMRTGSVVYHGSITGLRARAPEQAHEISATDDELTAKLATARGLDVTRHDDGLAVRGPQGEIDALVAEVVGHPTATPLPTSAPTPTPPRPPTGAACTG
jgi:ABC-2 type transport system ATP-binding protein